MEVPGDTHYVFVCQGKNCLTKGSAELLGQIRTALGGEPPVVLDGNAGAAALRNPVHSKG